MKTGPAAPEARSQVTRIRLLLGIFIVGLLASGATAIPLETELSFLTQWTGGESETAHWLLKVRDALVERGWVEVNNAEVSISGPGEAIVEQLREAS